MRKLFTYERVARLSFPYPSKRLITPHTARPAPIATTSVCKISTAELKKSILHLKQIKFVFAQIKNCWIFINSLPFPFYPFYPFLNFNCAAGIFPYGSALISWWLCFLFLNSLHLFKKFAISTPSYFAPSCRKVLFNKKRAIYLYLLRNFCIHLFSFYFKQFKLLFFPDFKLML